MLKSVEQTMNPEKIADMCISLPTLPILHHHWAPQINETHRKQQSTRSCETQAKIYENQSGSSENQAKSMNIKRGPTTLNENHAKINEHHRISMNINEKWKLKEAGTKFNEHQQ